MNNVQGTVWSEIAAAPFVTGSRAESVRCRLVDLFPARAAGKQVGASGSASKAASLVKYIPLARANNISIMLTQFRGGGHEGLREAILGGRDFTLEQLGVLLQLIPTEEETRIMANVDPKDAPGLSEPEKFLLALSKIPRLRNKIQCRVFMSQFDTWAAEFRGGPRRQPGSLPRREVQPSSQERPGDIPCRRQPPSYWHQPPRCPWDQAGVHAQDEGPSGNEGGQGRHGARREESARRGGV